MQSENINELITALSKAQSKIENAKKDNSNPFFKSKYADLTSVWEACRIALTENNIAVVQTTDMINGVLMMITTLAHSSGQWMRSWLPIDSDRKNPQVLGSAITYMRRYSLSMIVGVAPSGEDDDAQLASPRKEEIIEKPKTQTLSSKQVALLYARLKSHPEYKKQLEDYYSNNNKKLEDMSQVAFQKALEAIDQKERDLLMEKAN